MSTTAHELDALNASDLETKLREAKEELFNLRFQAATGQPGAGRRGVRRLRIAHATPSFGATERPSSRSRMIV